MQMMTETVTKTTGAASAKGMAADGESYAALATRKEKREKTESYEALIKRLSVKSVEKHFDAYEDVAWDAMVEIMGRYDVACEIIILGAEKYANALSHQRPFELNVERDGIPL